ncbi:MAG: alpha/beta hydrolase [Cytophagales bacterium]|nr:alpha/beta hydrolase [Cytophagales bacterium]
MPRSLKIVGRIVGILAGMYALAYLVFFVVEDRFIFFSESLTQNYVFNFNQPFEEYFIETDSGDSLNALLFKTNEPSRGLILYFHGNADNLQRWGNYAIDFTELGFEILMVDYRGYGKSSGKPGEDILYRDAQVVYDWAKENITYEYFVIYGRSLGTAVASNLAASANPNLLILETPFDKINSILYGFTSTYTFSNKDHMKEVTCPIVIIQGTADWVVPMYSAERLKPFLKKDDRFVVIEGGSHNNLRDFKLYHETLKSILN